MKQAGTPWLLAAVPLFFAILCLPMVLELVPPNAFYGVRMAATRASEAEWYRINRIAGIGGVIAGTLGFAANGLIIRSGLSPARRQLACLAVLVAVTLLIVAASLAAA